MAKVEKSFEAVCDFMARDQFVEACSREQFVHLKLGFSLWVWPTIREIAQQNLKSPSTVLTAHNSTATVLLCVTVTRVSVCSKILRKQFYN